MTFNIITEKSIQGTLPLENDCNGVENDLVKATPQTRDGRTVPVAKVVSERKVTSWGAENPLPYSTHLIDDYKPPASAARSKIENYNLLHYNYIVSDYPEDPCPACGGISWAKMGPACYQCASCYPPEDYPLHRAERTDFDTEVVSGGVQP